MSRFHTPCPMEVRLQYLNTEFIKYILDNEFYKLHHFAPVRGAHSSNGSTFSRPFLNLIDLKDIPHCYI